ncbi:hypothetical protein Dvina_18870 [Dactylosporangium vinaceum]|uniref:Uncharacterized protein n=1 Tax=Dactylosporangium vinaceum TaxID=53362 RepID=A0ABV5M991_9ACTN|nr:hypothetical protein [Dactylosporangium vinaceum]UAB99935.1 hypothetical protein Dvina_18870 [Dactylosporangium vinaceum]
MQVVLGPYPLCPACRKTNGGLIAVSHRQVHLRAHGKEACVDRGVAGLLANLWAVCDTRSCCENDSGRAYIVPTAETCDAAAQFLTTVGLRPEVLDGIIYFEVPGSPRLDDAESVRRARQRPTGMQATWYVNSVGMFELSKPADDADARDALE